MFQNTVFYMIILDSGNTNQILINILQAKILCHS